MKTNINRQYYSKLCEIESLIEKGFKNLTNSETTNLQKLSLAIKEYEMHKYAMPFPTEKL